MDIVILGSGRGSNANAILKAWKDGQLGKAQVKAVISDVPDAPILNIAKSYKVPARTIEINANTAKISLGDTNKLIDLTNEFKPKLVVLAGFMKILSHSFIQEYESRIINIHPSLLPSFKGLNAIKRAYERGVKISGCTVHWVSKGVDEGKIIAQLPVRVMDSDTLDNFTKKIHAAEHFLLPEVISQLSFADN
ncbi:MAG: phosphoribosylglycinamide formyltransferase [Verrucomicrobiota bacterium]|nr:phosphoribosylglycinamide formyltransferase [Verrucomicrobiota bacterium]